MKQFIAALFLLFSLTITGFGQWDWKYPVPQGNTLHEIFINNSSGLGYAVGNHGALLKTVNHGISWEAMESESTDALYSGCFIGNSCYLVGDNGIILKTTNNTNWSVISSGSHYQFNTVHFPDEIYGYIGGYKGIVMKTIDGGDSWDDLNTGTLYTIYAGYFFSSENGFFVGDSGLILKTTDAGTSWTKPNAGTLMSLLDVYFPSNSIGYIAGKKGLVLKTIDGGQSWTKLPFVPVENDLYSVYFIDDTLGYATGSFGTLIRTENGGISWGIIPTGTKLDIRDLHLLHHPDTLCDTLIFCGDYGLIQRTDSCGYWSNKTGASSHTLNSMNFWLGMKGIAVGGDPFLDLPAMLTTGSPESNWLNVNIDTIEHFLTDICMVDSNKWYVSGKKGSMYKTSDAGINWTPLETSTEEHLNSISFPDSTHGFATGDGGTLIRTFYNDTSWSDTAWVNLITGTTKNLYSLFFFNTLKGGYAVGDQGTILRIKNNGQQIHSVYSGTNKALYDICFTSDTIGFIVGNTGKIIKIASEYGADTVYDIPSGVTTPLNKIYFPCPDTGYIAGEGGLILKSTDGGETWYPQYTGTSNSLR
jgi:photosystem II stability/assembly factor-like uncharacterized protein